MEEFSAPACFLCYFWLNWIGWYLHLCFNQHLTSFCQEAICKIFSCFQRAFSSRNGFCLLARQSWYKYHRFTVSGWLILIHEIHTDRARWTSMMRGGHICRNRSSSLWGHLSPCYRCACCFKSFFIVWWCCNDVWWRWVSFCAKLVSIYDSDFVSDNMS